MKTWLMRVIAAAILCTIAQDLSPKGSVKQVGRLVCAMVLLCVVLSPVKTLDMAAGSQWLTNYRATLADSRAALAESGGITEAHAAYERLLGDAETVFLKLEDCALSGRDADYVKGFRTDLAAEQDTIARDGYNAAADRYNERVLGGFPARVLGTLTFVRPAETFR